MANDETAITATLLAQVVIYNTVGEGHPLMKDLRSAIADTSSSRARAASKAVAKLFHQGLLRSPRLTIAHEIEGDILAVANEQLKFASPAPSPGQAFQLAIAAFLAGCALEDALRRLCTSNQIAFDSHRSTISKLQSALYQPPAIEIISVSEVKQITAWGDTRNKADHGKFSEITYAEVLSMVIGVQSFIDRHLP